MSENEKPTFLSTMQRMLETAPDSTRVGIRAARIFLATMLQTDRDDATPDASAMGSMICMLIGMLRAEAAVGAGLSAIENVRGRFPGGVPAELEAALAATEAQMHSDALPYFKAAVGDVARDLSTFPRTCSWRRKGRPGWLW